MSSTLSMYASYTCIYTSYNFSESQWMLFTLSSEHWSVDSLTTAIVCFVSCRLVICRGYRRFYMQRPDSYLGLVCCASVSAAICDTLYSLYYPQHVVYTLCLLTYTKCHHGLAPIYLMFYCVKLAFSCTTLSAPFFSVEANEGSRLLFLSHLLLVLCRALSAPATWNEMPAHLRNSDWRCFRLFLVSVCAPLWQLGW